MAGSGVPRAVLMGWGAWGNEQQRKQQKEHFRCVGNGLIWLGRVQASQGRAALSDPDLRLGELRGWSGGSDQGVGSGMGSGFSAR